MRFLALLPHSKKALCLNQLTIQIKGPVVSNIYDIGPSVFQLLPIPGAPALTGHFKQYKIWGIWNSVTQYGIWGGGGHLLDTLSSFLILQMNWYL